MWRYVIIEKFILEKSNILLTPSTGLAVIGALLSKTQLRTRLNQVKWPWMGKVKISNGDIATSYLGLICQGKTDFDDIEPYREDQFFAMSLDIPHVPAAPTLRQRIGLAAKNPICKQIIKEESADLIRSVGAPLTPIELMDSSFDSEPRKYIVLDVDVTPFDNSKTKKEGVSFTYKKVDGFAPIFAYLGEEGYCVNLEFREGNAHSQKGTPNFLRDTVKYARRITSLPLLLRADSGNDSMENIRICHASESKIDYIIKWNRRKENLATWLLKAEEQGIAEHPRPGKVIYYGEEWRPCPGLDGLIRLVYRLIARTEEANGQFLMDTEVELDAFWTTLPDSPKKVIELYGDHGTSEQFHSEVKTDLDLERLPSEEFKSNDLTLHFGLMSYNLLRIIGQESLKKQDAPLKNKKVRRRRIRTVIQNLITIASQVVFHARRWRLKFGRFSPWFITLKRIYEAFA